MGYNTIRCPKNAPLAQLVEQLTLNQWVQGSSPWRCTIREWHEPRLGLVPFSYHASLTTQNPEYARQSRAYSKRLAPAQQNIPLCRPRRGFRVPREHGFRLFRTPNMRGGAVHIPSVSPRHSKSAPFVVRDAGSESQATATFGTIQNPARASSERFCSLLMIRRDGKGKTGVVKGMCFGSFFFFKEEFVSCRQITHYMEH